MGQRQRNLQNVADQQPTAASTKQRPAPTQQEVLRFHELICKRMRPHGKGPGRTSSEAKHVPFGEHQPKAEVPCKDLDAACMAYRWKEQSMCGCKLAKRLGFEV